MKGDVTLWCFSAAQPTVYPNDFERIRSSFPACENVFKNKHVLGPVLNVHRSKSEWMSPFALVEMPKRSLMIGCGVLLFLWKANSSV